MNRTIQELTDQFNDDVPRTFVSTGNPDLDAILCPGKGLPSGRLIELYGSNGVGKTTLALKIIAAAQSQGQVAAFIAGSPDRLDLRYSRERGVDNARLLLSQPDDPDQMRDVLEALVRSGQVGIVVVDTLTDLHKDETKGLEGVQARLETRYFRRLADLAKQTDTLVLFIHEHPAKIVPNDSVSDPVTSPIALSLKFYVSLRLALCKTAEIRNGSKVVGHVVQVKTTKNKLAPPFQETTLELP